MKDINWRKIFGISWRVLSVIVVLCTGSLVLIHSIFNGNEKINNLLFSQKADVSLFAPLIVAWVFGFFEGVICIFLLFVKDLSNKDAQIEALKTEKNSRIIALQKEIASLRKKLGKFKKEEAESPADRVFDVISDPSLESSDSTESNGTSVDNGTGINKQEPFYTLQDLIRRLAKVQSQKSESSQQAQKSEPESQEPKDSGPDKE